ncbi:Hypothetical predicted protein [Pelobates cultripes]|uniref:Uncharacterized protein n=1 Tax=Pelobates cultripes TaxID=61616 RepID=A0AAD1RYY6_PELCU|nr:Hypothetical predicted protein [Pelobates cultripes]
MRNKEMIPFPKLQTQWQLPNRAIFSYLQLKSILTAYTPRSSTTPDPKWVAPYQLLDRCWSTPTKPKTLALCYKVWQEITPTVPQSYKAQWEADCNETLTDENWLHALNGLSKWTRCFSHIEAHRKLMYHWYMTPSVYSEYSLTPHLPVGDVDPNSYHIRHAGHPRLSLNPHCMPTITTTCTAKLRRKTDYSVNTNGGKKPPGRRVEIPQLPIHDATT